MAMAMAMAIAIAVALAMAIRDHQQSTGERPCIAIAIATTADKGHSSPCKPLPAAYRVMRDQRHEATMAAMAMAATRATYGREANQEIAPRDDALERRGEPVRTTCRHWRMSALLTFYCGARLRACARRAVARTTAGCVCECDQLIAP